MYRSCYRFMPVAMFSMWSLSCLESKFIPHHTITLAFLRSIPTRGTASAARSPGSTTRSCCFTSSSNISDERCILLGQSPVSTHFHSTNHSPPPSNSDEFTAEDWGWNSFPYIFIHLFSFWKLSQEHSFPPSEFEHVRSFSRFEDNVWEQTGDNTLSTKGTA